MGQKNVSAPVVAAIIVVVVLLAGFFLYKGATGGTVGDGKAGNVEASPPMPDAAKQQMMQQAAQGRR
jgi:hypothetical protein